MYKGQKDQFSTPKSWNQPESTKFSYSVNLSHLCAAEHHDGLDLPVRPDPADVVVVADVEGSVGAGRHGPHAQDGRLLGHPVAVRGVATVEIVLIVRLG